MTSKFICANWGSEYSTCKKEGKYACKNCLLVNYCGRACQRSHWPRHKNDCKSILGKGTWQPDWVIQKRTPAFAGSRTRVFGGTKSLWGSTPALDILQLPANEGDNYDKDLSLLFEASGDLRNVIQTVARLPSSYNRSLHITMNDIDFDIAARNALMLLIALSLPNREDSIDCIIHLWYSALVRESDISILTNHIHPLVEGICRLLKYTPAGSLCSKKWTFGSRSLKVILEREAWFRLLSLCTAPVGLTAEQAQKLGTDITLAESRTDYRHRQMMFLPPTERIAFHRFRQDGLLLPFGHPRREFVKPNPTFFQSADRWPMSDNADPMQGWSLEKVLDTSSGAATADYYGKLYFHLRELLGAFLDRTAGAQISFQICNLDSTRLCSLLRHHSFSRIDISNTPDMSWRGTYRLLRRIAPLLRSPSQNPHAVLISRFKKVSPDTLNANDQVRNLIHNCQSRERILAHLQPNAVPDSPYDVYVIKHGLARQLVASYDQVLQCFLKWLRSPGAGQALGIKIKERHTVVEKWPYRLKLRPGEPDAQMEFDRFLRQGLSGKERYVEWRKFEVA
ncbi:uncharacterized protein BP01DRAFT_405627 [Aspergillus saccharolyticus JOP 1030-1]|uniref:MYND-type domain-containing protein n=1 Tax=Aspergillus saccharolyticus JOP 1030-1 TaxID=1450539 RepID=A0A318ZEW0_9EURO|nr:hypothetical protein BP01DRAFT_405627 [Aspergillus saccharolyticus JOP 1030-1]PYH42140.1 hypothetical protein BP01DRAFT_405627 [Aspergillus saccharolyticus JOP 1030-1]